MKGPFHYQECNWAIISETAKTEGLIHIFAVMEQCNTYKPRHNKTTGKTFLKFDQSKWHGHIPCGMETL